LIRGSFDPPAAWPPRPLSALSGDGYDASETTTHAYSLGPTSWSDGSPFTEPGDVPMPAAGDSLIRPIITPQGHGSPPERIDATGTRL
jgi:hypothetical protein